MLSFLAAGCGGSAETDAPATDLEPAPEASEVEQDDSIFAPPESSDIDEGGTILRPDLWFVVAGDRPMLALSHWPDESDAIGEPRSVTETVENPLSDPLRYRAVSSHSSIHADALAAIGRDVQLFSKNGHACDARIGEIGIVHRADLDAVVADGALLVARLDALGGDCAGARWAIERGEPQPGPTVFVPEAAVDRELESAAFTAFRDLPEYAEIQLDYDTFEPADATRLPRVAWENYDSGAAEAQAWQDPESGRRLLRVSAAAGAGCGDFYGRLWAIFEVVGERLTPVVVEKRDAVPDHVLDSDRDGRLEFLSGDVALLPSEQGYVEKDSQVNAFHCPC